MTNSRSVSMAKPPGSYLEYADHGDIYTSRRFPEQIVDLGEIRMNYAVCGESINPALLLLPGQTNPWWSYEDAMQLLASEYQVFAVDIRGHGRSTWTPGRYSLNIIGNDLVRFIERVVGRSVIVCGLSSGGLIAAWLSAFALPGQILGAVYEDPPVFASQLSPPIGQSAKQTFAYPLFRAWSTWLGPQWSIGDVKGFEANIECELPFWYANAVAKINETGRQPIGTGLPPRHYDPEWASAFIGGKFDANCDHEAMLKQVKVPVLFTHHLRYIDPVSGNMIGAISDLQVAHVKRLVEGTGNSFTLLSFPDHPHSMHGSDPATYVRTITKWMSQQGFGKELSPSGEGMMRHKRQVTEHAMT